MPLSFDSIWIREGSEWRETTLERFLALPLTTRIRHAIAGSVSFRLDGEVVDPNAALASIRQTQIAS